MLQIYVTMATKPLHCLGFPKAHYFQKLYIYEERKKKTIVRANNSFQLWMINTWVTYQNKKFFSNLRYHGNIRDFTSYRHCKRLKYL